MLGIFVVFLITSCDIWPEYVWFENQSSYIIRVNCKETNPSSFTLYPVNGKLMVEYKISKITDSNYEPKINFKYNDNDLVSVSVDNAGWIVFKNK